jgi:endo-1,4-beta-xylanase
MKTTFLCNNVVDIGYKFFTKKISLGMKYFIGIKILLVISVIIAWQTSHEKFLFNEVNSTGNRNAEEPSLKKIFKNDFLVGTALNVPQIEEKENYDATLIPAQFNAITAENIMKCALIHPEWNKYNFDLADKFVAYGKKNNMFIVGHTLIWHSQLSPFVAGIKSSDSLLQFMTDHINTVAGRYAGKVNSWDVVNEALNEDGTLRKSIFLEKLGEDYIRKAFELAAKAAPDAELYYNDYNIEQPQKRAGAVALIKKLQASGTKIDGVGIQGHWSITGLPLQDIENSIIEFSALGLKVSFTELDITVLPNPWDLKGADVNQNFEGSPFMNPYPKSLPDSVQNKLAKCYENLFKMFIKHKDKIERVTFWGVNDGQSWLNNWPIKGRTNYPLLFDRSFRPKPALEKVVALTKNQ